MMKRSAALFVLAGALALVVAAGVAFADTVECQGDAFVCVGTDGLDLLLGTDSREEMEGLQGDDVLRGFEGHDELVGDRADHPDDPPTETTGSTAA
jgi:Ca2+-binding RTX toxin-like protein